MTSAWYQFLEIYEYLLFLFITFRGAFTYQPWCMKVYQLIVSLGGGFNYVCSFDNVYLYCTWANDAS